MNNTSLNITLPNGNSPSPDSLLHGGGGGGNFPKFYPGGGTLAYDLLPPDLLERFTLFSNLFRMATAFFKEQAQLAASLLPLVPVKEEPSKDSLSVRIEDFLLPTVFPEQTFTVYPVGEASAATPDGNIPPLWALALSSLCEKGPLPELDQNLQALFFKCLKGITHQPGMEVLVALHEAILAEKAISPEEKIRKFYTEIKKLAKEYLYSPDSAPLSAEETVLNPILAEKNFNPFHVTHIKGLAEAIQKVEEKKDLLITARALWSQDIPIPVDNAENLLTWLENPDNQAALGQIQDLSFSYGRLRTIPTKILQYCSGLQELSLSGNQISRIEPRAFQGLGRLQKLSLSRNQISRIEPEAWQGLGSLQELYLSGNQISRIEPRAWQGLGSLQELYLSGNQISRIEPEAFQGLGNLQGLSLSGNQISRLDPGAFQGLENLQGLDLFMNQISRLDPGAFEGLPEALRQRMEEEYPVKP